jgi:FKBP-type peptidyl-prolyl cis-trans isomerase
MLFACCLFSCKNQKTVNHQKEHNTTKDELIEVNRILVIKDQQRIKGYLERNDIQMQQTETGLWYLIDKQGEGPKAEAGRRATINYRIGLLDGTECYNSKKDGPKSFVIGRGGVESGLEEGILLMNEGGKANFIMPPYLAHGLPGDGNRIPARAIIVYDVELVSID